MKHLHVFLYTDKNKVYFNLEGKKKILDRYWSYSDQWLITIFLFWHIEKHLNMKQKVWKLYSIISAQHQAEEKENKKINLKRVF